jgi:hypothetical protein
LDPETDRWFVYGYKSRGIERIEESDAWVDKHALDSSCVIVIRYPLIPDIPKVQKRR